MRLGAGVVSGEFNVPLIITGAGLIGLGIPFSVAYSKNAVKAVGIYNDSIIRGDLITTNENDEIKKESFEKTIEVIF